jgi:hypothetical protein
VAEPATDRPKPIGHVVHVAQATLPAEALKEPSAQVAHVRSALAVAALLMKVPAAHGALTLAHAAPSLAPENVEPA